MGPDSQDVLAAEADMDRLRRARAAQQALAPQAPTVPQPVATHAPAAHVEAAPAAPQSVPAAPCGWAAAEPSAPSGWHSGASAPALGPPLARADVVPCSFSDSRIASAAHAAAPPSAPWDAPRQPQAAAAAHATAAAPPPPPAPSDALRQPQAGLAVEPSAPAGWSAGATAAAPAANPWRQQAPPPPQPHMPVASYMGTPPGDLPKWMEFRGVHKEPYCLYCNKYITEEHLRSQMHQSRVGPDGFEAALRAAHHGPPPATGGRGMPPPGPPSWAPEAEGIRGPPPPPPPPALQAPPLQAGSAGPPGGRAAPAPCAAACAGAAIASWAGGASAGQYPGLLPPGDPEWYEWNHLQYKFYCKLCGKYAEDGHVRSEMHRKRAQYPEWYLSSSGGHSSIIAPGPLALQAWPSQAPAAASQPWPALAPPAQGDPPPRTPSDLPPGWYANWEAMNQTFVYYQVDGVTGKWINMRWEKPSGGVLALTDGAASSVAQPAPVAAATAAAPTVAASSVAAPAPAADGAGWTRHWSQEHSRHYYHHAGAGETTWSEPPAYEDLPARAAPAQAELGQAAVADWAAAPAGAVHDAGFTLPAAQPAAALAAAQPAAAQAAPAAWAAAPAAQASPAAPAAATPAPAAEWTRHWADEYDRPYWHNARTGESSWEPPVDESGVDV